MQFYTDPARENDPHALPNAEVFEVSHIEVERYSLPRSVLHMDLTPGYYWRPRFPGCLPDSDPIGPFETKDKAIQDAREES